MRLPTIRAPVCSETARPSGSDECCSRRSNGVSRRCSNCDTRRSEQACRLAYVELRIRVEPVCHESGDEERFTPTLVEDVEPLTLSLRVRSTSLCRVLYSCRAFERKWGAEKNGHVHSLRLSDREYE